MTDARDIVELIEELQELGEHPCRAELPFGATLREASAALTSLRKQLEDAREALIQADLICSLHGQDITPETLSRAVVGAQSVMAKALKKMDNEGGKS